MGVSCGCESVDAIWRCRIVWAEGDKCYFLEILRFGGWDFAIGFGFDEKVDFILFSGSVEVLGLWLDEFFSALKFRGY